MSFRREWSVTIGALRIAAPIRVKFEIERTLKATPNKATVSVYNLTRDHQANIAQADMGTQVLIAAGFEDERGAETIFAGELFRARAGKSIVFGKASGVAGTESAGGIDAITTVQARDGGRSFAHARVSMAFDEGVSISTVLRALADSLGVGAGNIDEVADVARALTGDDTYPQGTVISGSAPREMTRVLAALDLRWSVQHGAIQVLSRGSALQTEAVRLAPNTGLIGSPERGTRGHVRAVALMTPGLWPGRRVELASRLISGLYTCEAVKDRGDSHANDWFAECDLVPEAA